MNNPLLAEFKRTRSTETAYNFPDDDDDDDDDALVDDDEEEDIAAPRNERWFNGSGFGSPEWWSRY